MAELQLSLAGTEAKLREKNAAAESKLSLMLEKQGEAEKEKEKLQQLSVQLAAKDGEIALRTEVVMKDLALAEPALSADM